MFDYSRAENDEPSESEYRDHAGHVARTESKGTRAEPAPSNSPKQNGPPSRCAEQYELEEGDDLEEGDNLEQHDDGDNPEDDNNEGNISLGVDEECDLQACDETEFSNTVTECTCAVHKKKKKKKATSKSTEESIVKY